MTPFRPADVSAMHPDLELDEASTTSATLRLAGVWLAVLAVLGIAAFILVASLFSDWPSDEGYPLRMGLLLAVSSGCGLIAVVAWRAGAPDRPRAGILTFAIGVFALVVILLPAVVVLLPSDGLYGLDLYAVGSAARFPWSVVILVPASLMVAGTVNRWRAARDVTEARRRTRIATAATLVILVPILGLAAVDAAQPACGWGRVCVAKAGISFDLPDRWSRTAPESNELYAAVAGNDRTRFVIEDGARAIRDAGGTVPADIAGLVARVPPLIEGGDGLFGRNTGVSAERVALPVGLAARVAYTSATSFFFTYYQTTISHWFFVDGRIVVLEYMQAFGESTPSTPSSDPPDLRKLLDSLATL
jgi:hypothetical protein